jgi:hypothetical protein
MIETRPGFVYQIIGSEMIKIIEAATLWRRQSALAVHGTCNGEIINQSSKNLLLSKFPGNKCQQGNTSFPFSVTEATRMLQEVAQGCTYQLDVPKMIMAALRCHNERDYFSRVAIPLRS